MTYAPPTIVALAAYWVSKGGFNSGIVGDAPHRARPSYHNGWDAAVARYGTTNMATIASRDYTYQLARDKVKSSAASALDLGKLNGSLTNLQRFSVWLVREALANPAKYRDVREIIYSPDGKTVKRWSGEDNKIYAVPLTSDVARSHLWHTHMSFYRDSEARAKLALFQMYFEKEVSLAGFAINLGATADSDPTDAIGPAKVVGDGHYMFRADTKQPIKVANGLVLGTVSVGVLVPSLDEQLGRPKLPPPADRSNIVLFNHAGFMHFMLKVDTDFKPMGPFDCKVPVAAAAKAGFNEGLAAGESAIHILPRR